MNLECTAWIPKEVACSHNIRTFMMDQGNMDKMILDKEDKIIDNTVSTMSAN